MTAPEAQPELTRERVEEMLHRWAHSLDDDLFIEAPQIAGWGLAEHAARLTAEAALTRALARAEALEGKAGIDDLLSDWGVSHPVLKRGWSDSQWEAEYIHDRITYTGRGDTPEEALVEAHVDNRIANYYYYGDMDAPTLSMETMGAWRAADYLAYLGYPAEGEYRGDYHPERRAALAPAPAEAEQQQGNEEG